MAFLFYGWESRNQDLYCMPKRRTIYALCWLTLLGFTGLAEIILRLGHDSSILNLIGVGWDWYYQLPIGLAVGWIAGQGAKRIITSRPLQKVKVEYISVIRQLQLRPWEIIFLSFCAGFGEEWLFRGALQPWMGIWITSVVFVAVHGYLNPMDWRISIYGGAMVLFIAAMGWMFDTIGPFSAIAAHFIFDVVMLSLPELRTPPPMPEIEDWPFENFGLHSTEEPDSENF